MRALLAGIAVAVAVITTARRPARRLPGATAPRAAWPTTATVGSATAGLLDRVRPQRRLARRDAQLPDALDRLAAALRAGQAIGPALGDLVRSAPEPLASDLRRVDGAIAQGVSVEVAMEAWAARPDASADARLVAAALGLGAHAGGEVARAVDRIAATLRERRELRGEVHALATQARASAAVLAIAPVGFTGLVATVEPGVVAFLVTTPVGLACLALGLGLEASGAAWMARITGRAG